MNVGRRSFVSQIALLSLGLVRHPNARRSADMSIAGDSGEPWLEGLHGHHRIFCDTPALLAGRPLNRVGTLFDAYGKSYGLADADVNAVFGAHAAGIGFVLRDEMWSRYALGTYLGIPDVKAKQPATRNLFADEQASAEFGYPSVPSLQHRGVRFIACMQTIAHLSRSLASQRHEEEHAIHDALLNGLLPGVFPVPAMIVAINRAQETGLSYIFLG